MEVSVSNMDSSFMSFDAETNQICVDVASLGNITQTIQIEITVTLYDSKVDMSNDYVSNVVINPDPRNTQPNFVISSQ